MKTLQRSFGINGDMGGRQDPNASAENKLTISNGESQRVSRVRHQCKLQNDILSSWWKTALQANIKQRMWMQLGQHEDDEVLPTRFERLYQPEKLGQFDRFFSRGWATPVRRSHSAQHSDGPENESEASGLTRVISENFHSTGAEQTNAGGSGGVSARYFFAEEGFAPHQKPELRSFLKRRAGQSNSGSSNFLFLGESGPPNEEVRPEYGRYVGDTQNLEPASRACPRERREEFETFLRDYSLNANDVAGVRKVRIIFLSTCPLDGLFCSSVS